MALKWMLNNGHPSGKIAQTNIDNSCQLIRNFDTSQNEIFLSKKKIKSLKNIFQ